MRVVEGLRTASSGPALFFSNFFVFRPLEQRRAQLLSGIGVVRAAVESELGVYDQAACSKRADCAATLLIGRASLLCRTAISARRFRHPTPVPCCKVPADWRAAAVAVVDRALLVCRPVCPRTCCPIRDDECRRPRQSSRGKGNTTRKGQTKMQQQADQPHTLIARLTRLCLLLSLSVSLAAAGCRWIAGGATAWSTAYSTGCSSFSSAC